MARHHYKRGAKSGSNRAMWALYFNRATGVPEADAREQFEKARTDLVLARSLHATLLLCAQGKAVYPTRSYNKFANMLHWPLWTGGTDGTAENT